MEFGVLPGHEGQVNPHRDVGPYLCAMLESAAAISAVNAVEDLIWVRIWKRAKARFPFY